MRLTRQSEIAFGILASCARRPGAMTRTWKLARETGTTKDHAAQVVAKLVRNGYLASERGRDGGVRLAADPKSIRLADILRLSQPDLSAFDDERDGEHPSGDPGLVDVIVSAASTSLLRLMERFTVADLLLPSAASRQPHRLHRVQPAFAGPAFHSASRSNPVSAPFRSNARHGRRRDTARSGKTRPPCPSP